MEKFLAHAGKLGSGVDERLDTRVQQFDLNQTPNLSARGLYAGGIALLIATGY